MTLRSEKEIDKTITPKGINQGEDESRGYDVKLRVKRVRVKRIRVKRKNMRFIQSHLT